MLLSSRQYRIASQTAILQALKHRVLAWSAAGSAESGSCLWSVRECCISGQPALRCALLHRLRTRSGRQWRIRSVRPIRLAMLHRSQPEARQGVLDPVRAWCAAYRSSSRHRLQSLIHCCIASAWGPAPTPASRPFFLSDSQCSINAANQLILHYELGIVYI